MAAGFIIQLESASDETVTGNEKNSIVIGLAILGPVVSYKIFKVSLFSQAPESNFVFSFSYTVEKNFLGKWGEWGTKFCSPIHAGITENRPDCKSGACVARFVQIRTCYNEEGEPIPFCEGERIRVTDEPCTLEEYGE